MTVLGQEDTFWRSVGAPEADVELAWLRRASDAGVLA